MNQYEAPAIVEENDSPVISCGCPKLFELTCGIAFRT
jgi:hypothetical protein